MLTQDALADQIRTLYVQHRYLHEKSLNADYRPITRLHAKWDGGVDSRGKHYKPIWPRLAAFAEKNNIDPVVWVQTLFSLAGTFDHVPWPQDLLLQKIIAKLHSSKEDICEAMRAELISEILLLRREILFSQAFSNLNKDTICRTVLADPSISVSPLTRYVTALSFGENDIAESFAESAAFQFSTYEDACKDVFNNEILEKLKQLHSEFKGESY